MPNDGRWMDALAARFVGSGGLFVSVAIFQRMKPLFLFITLLATSNLYAQDSVASQDFIAGPFTCRDMSGFYGKVLYCGYSNAKYKSLIDRQSILFRSHKEIVELTDDLREALEYVTKGNEAEGTWILQVFQCRSLRLGWVNSVFGPMMDIQQFAQKRRRLML